MRNVLRVTRMSSADAVALNEQVQTRVADCLETYGDQSVGIHILGDELLLRSGETVHVMDEATHDISDTFTVAGALGAALAEGGVLLEGIRTGGDAFMALYDYAGTLIDEVAVPVGYATPSFITVVAGTGHTVHSVSKRLFSVTSAGLQEIDAPHVGLPARLYSSGATVHVRGRFTAETLNVSDPALPAIIDGGPIRSALAGTLLDVSLTPAGLVSENTPSAQAFSIRDDRVHRVDLFDLDLPAAEGDLELPSENTVYVEAGDHLYAATLDISAGDVLVRMWRRSDLAEADVIEPLSLTIPRPATLEDVTFSNGIAFGVDPQTRIAAIAVGDATLTGEETPPRAALHFVDLSSGWPTLMGTDLLDKAPSTLLVRGESVALGSSGLLRFRDFGAEEEQVYDGSWARLLAFDGTTLYFGTAPSYSSGPELVVLNRNGTGGPAEEARIPLDSDAVGLAEAETAWVLGMTNGLALIHPLCGENPDPDDTDTQPDAGTDAGAPGDTDLDAGSAKGNTAGKTDLQSPRQK